jgi:hypothetical protein
VIGGLGLAVISLFALRDELLLRQRIRHVPAEGFPLPGRWHGVRRADRAITPAVAALQGFVAAAAPELSVELARLLEVGRGAPRRRRR